MDTPGQNACCWLLLKAARVDDQAHKYHYWYHPLVRVHNDATSDLREIRTTDVVAFNRLVAFIQQLKVDPSLIDRLLDHGAGSDRTGPISVMQWLSVKKVERVPLWRVKSWDLERNGLKYRLIYCYNWPDKSYNIMAVVSRDSLNYDDPQHPIRKRVVQRIREEFPRA